MIDLVEDLINNQAEESQILEFKGVKEFRPSDPAFLNKLSVIISSFANTNGGLLIYGVNTNRRKASDLENVDTEGISENSLYYAIQSRIQKPVEGLEVHFVKTESKSEQTLVVFRIPESRQAPHMAFDNRYYKRMNYKEAVMEEQEVRLLYNRTNIADLEFFGVVNTNGVPLLSEGKIQTINFYPRFLIRNISSTIEHHYKLEVSFPVSLHDSGYNGLQSYFSRHEGSHAVFTIPNKTPLFQEELTSVIEGKICLTGENYDDFDSGVLRIKLFYSKGIKTHEFNMSDTFLYKNNKLREEDFLH